MASGETLSVLKEVLAELTLGQRPLRTRVLVAEIIGISYRHPQNLIILKPRLIILSAYCFLY